MSASPTSGLGMTSQRSRDRMVRQLKDMGIHDARVLEVMRTTPRHLFVEEGLAHRAYDNTPLPIGYEQTISQPYIVARMTEACLQRGQPQKVLEIGTGSGYQAAVLAQLVPRVVSLERIRPLQRQAREVLNVLKLDNVSLRHVDGFGGWPEDAPYDVILLTAAPVEVPAALLDQLTLGGQLLAPVGAAGRQNLIRLVKTDQGFEKQDLGAVSFVPLLPGAIA
ncbi:protein-L-isoaspartate(D-aspartate) O-methyltransferase [Ectothiorhodosinus mongolicus]|uniref:Protein-L-isoaspartate O-methyltransferase n=2 Tax=Ectothiorhodosinus mongolicus TaxID=233100 RepID=A0A1R3VRR6_9GAMM|nr:protein-L-isoaspartate(D-aspartate) O-methyltransferase [Ectothiorhodosinus mongolicus]